MQPRDLVTAKKLKSRLWSGKAALTARVAHRLDTTEQVIKNYLRNTFDKLGVWRRLELALYLASRGGTKWQGDLTPAEESPARIPVSGD